MYDILTSMTTCIYMQTKHAQPKTCDMIVMKNCSMIKIYVSTDVKIIKSV